MSLKNNFKNRNKSSVEKCSRRSSSISKDIGQLSSTLSKKHEEKEKTNIILLAKTYHYRHRKYQ